MADMSQVISDSCRMYINIFLSVVVRSMLSVAGVVTNLINMVIFSKLGLKDSISVGLFSLSLTDFLVTAVQLVSCVIFVMDLLRVNTAIDIMYLGYYSFGWAISCVYEISCWITAMISIERCYCVVSPFTVKQVFTRFRCVVGILTIYIVYVSVHIPVYSEDLIKSFEITLLLENNTTAGISESVIIKRFNSDTFLLNFILDIIAGVSLWMCSQVVVIVCAVWMGYSLKTSSKVRYFARYKSENRAEWQHAVYSKHSSTLSNRERRMVKVVLFLATTQACCNVPKMITTVLFYSLPGLSNGNQDNLSTLLWALGYTFATLGCSVSFVVYLKLNASYRREFNNLLSPQIGDTNMTISNTSAVYHPKQNGCFTSQPGCEHMKKKVI